MADISQITLPTGTTYNIKDATARSLIDEMSNYTDFLGVTTSPLIDGSTTNPITINGTSVTAKKGNIVTYGSAEFIFNGSAWQAFGDLSALGSLAYKSSASGSYTPAGSVSQPTFTGSSITSTGNFTPAGTVSKPTFSGTKIYAHHTFTGSSTTSTGNFTPAGSVATTYNSTSSGANGNFTPAGSVSKPTFSGNSLTSTGTFTPAGTVSPTVTVNTTTVNSITAVGTLPSWTATVSGETLTIGWSAGTLPTKGSNTTVATGIKSATASFTGTEGNISVSGTPSGTVSQPTFSGTKMYAHHTFTGTQGSVSVSGTPAGSVATTYNSTSTNASGNFTPAGTVSQPSFTGTEGNVSVSGTPSGTVSQPSFTGTAATITVE